MPARTNNKATKSNVIDLRAHRRNVTSTRRKAKAAPPSLEERELDLQIGLVLLGTAGCVQLCHYLRIRNERAQRPALARAS